jgi:hypothetical protein
MVADEFLGQFVSGMVVVTRNLVDDLHLLQVGQVSIHRALGQSRSSFQQLRHRRWATKSQKEIDQLSSASRVHQTGLAKSLSNLVVDRLAMRLHCDERT